MKTFLSVLISYILLCVAGIACAAALFMVYIGCMNYVVGQPLSLFSFGALKTGIDISIPLVVIFIPMFLILSLIRHSRKNRIIGVITTIVLSCASWGLGLPAYMKYVQRDSDITRMEKKRLSSGYFRLSDNTIYYFTNVDNEKKADGILIDASNMGADVASFKIIHGEKVEIPESENFSDILVKNTVEIPELLKMSFMDLYYISVCAKNSLSHSFVSWLFFASLGLALVFVFALSNMSHWRLINAFSVLVATGVVLKVNAILCGTAFYAKYLPFLPSLADSFKKLGSIFNYMESPLCVIANVSLILIFVIIGVAAKLFKHPVPQEEDEE